MVHTYKIAVYDDRVESINNLKEMIQEIMLKNHIINYVVHSFFDCSELSQKVINLKYQYDIYFFRMNDREKSSMDYAEYFRSKDIWNSFVYINDNTCTTSNGYKVKLMDYLFEPINKGILENLLLYDYENNYLIKYIPLRKNSKLFYINMNDLVCVEVYGRGIKLYLSDTLELRFLLEESYLKEDINMVEKSLRYTEKLSDFKDKLNPRIFIQCHQSFMVNINKIKSMKRYQAILDNKTFKGMKADISKKYWNQLRDRFIENMLNKTNQQIRISDEYLEQVAGGRNVFKDNLIGNQLDGKREGD